MGATQWSYFVPHQPDISKALHQLRDHVFEQGQHEQPFGFDQNALESQLDYLAKKYQSLPKAIRVHTDQSIQFARAVAKQHPPRQSPESIKQWLEQCGTEGAHSIPVIDRASPEPTFGAIAPLPRERVLEIFGTEYQARDMVEKWSARVDAFDAEPLCKRWGGIYIIVYRDTEAVEI
jgi:hypothetical protein